MKPITINIPSRHYKERRGGTDAIDTLVVHAMGEWVLDKGVYHHCTDWLNHCKYSVHAFCLPDGRIIQSVDPEKKAFHAGEFNNRSIGMEFVVAGGHDLESLHQKMADTDNPPYTQAQYEAGGYWFRKQADRFGLKFKDIKSHRELDPDRKQDPGKAFNWTAFKAAFDAVTENFNVIDVGYDNSYGTVENVFGDKPESILVSHLEPLDKRKRVLDIGVGQGRNALYLAKEGFKVDGIDTSEVSIRQVTQRAENENLPVNAFHTDFDSFQPAVKSYSGILLFGIIQVLDWDGIRRLIKKIDQWTTSGSLVFITAFTTDCPTFTRYSQEWEKTGKNSFTGPNGQISTYLEKGELLTLFDNFEAIYHWVGMGPLHRHGDGPLEQHGKVEAVFKKASQD